jgi:LPS sulfotransferase NodH
MEIASGHWAARPESRLLLILSSERSGSTLLRVMLGGHSRIVAPQELFLLRYPDFETWRARKPVAMESLIELFALLGKPTTEAAVTAACRGRSTVDVYKWVFEALPPGALIIDKTPAYANDATTLTRSAALAPFYIWLVRHPLGVIDSHVRLKQNEQRQRPFPRRLLRPLRDAVQRWTDGMSALARTREAKWVLQNLNVRDFLRDVAPGQQALLRFEDLVRNPEPVVRGLCEAIGIEPETTMLRPQTRQVMNPNLGDPNFHLHGGIDADPADNWGARYSESVLRPETLQLMRQIGIGSPGSPDSHAA